MSARILIIDDIPANTRLLGAQLGAEYFEVRAAHDGATAITEALEWQPDIILLDVMMPGMDGYETCRRLKADVRTLHIPVVMVTSLDQTDERVRGLDVGADDFLTKPVDFDTLLARVKSLVRLKRLLDEWRMRGKTAHALGLSAGSTAVPTVAGARALVVDDDDASAALIQDALARDGVLAARVSTEAGTMEMVQAIDFALVVISLSMLSDDPLRLASRLRAQESTQETPLLLIAEPEQRDRLLRGFDLGANDWLVRPLEPNEVRARARNQIRRKFYQDRLRADLGYALELALTDPLTGFYNQRYLMSHLSGLLSGSGVDRIGVMMLDLDHFKEVNDRWGHPVGDQALRLVADTLRARVRLFDSIARYGGEEFVVVMPGTTEQEAEAAAERLRIAIEQIRFEPEPGVWHRLTVSIGVVCVRPGPTPERVLQLADAALYRAKDAGRNCMKVAAGD
jgi:two-component system cell cycle response regulator